MTELPEPKATERPMHLVFLDHARSRLRMANTYALVAGKATGTLGGDELARQAKRELDTARLMLNAARTEHWLNGGPRP